MSFLASARRVPSLAHGGRRTFFTIIHQGHEGWRLSFGRNPTRLAPGIQLMIPFYHTVQEVDLRERSVNIHDLSGFTADNTPVTLSGSLFFRVNNSYSACFAVDDFQHNIRNIGTSAMRSVVGHFSYDDVIGDRNRINLKLHEVIGGSIEKWGVECTRFEIQTFKPSNRDVERQLELQMEAERNRRKQLLDTQAAVNVAEGHKQRAILESEGELQSQLNQAEGTKRRLILESEGRLESARNESRALSAQVELVARALNANPGEAERRLALDTLVELRRLEQLRAIAGGKGNNTYFFGERGGAYDVDNMEKWKRTLGEEGALRASVRPGADVAAHTTSAAVPVV